MLKTSSIEQIPTTEAHVFAFRIRGRVSRDDFHAMGEMMNRAFDGFDRVNMLLVFDGFEGRETGASWDPEAMKAQFRSLGTVERYVVVGAPPAASGMVEAFGAMLPVKAEAFPREEEDAAWATVGARPLAA